MISLRSDRLRLEISPHGAEPRSLRDSADRELLWQAAAPWNRSACILFPAICRHEGDVIRAAQGSAGEHTWPMPKHGLVRDLDFDVLEVEETRAVLSMQSSEDTRRSYPWDFTLHVEYLLDDATLTTRYTVFNRTSSDHGAGTTMAYALGSHPAFAWPLPGSDDAGAPGAAASTAGSSDTQASTATQDEPLHVLEFEAPTPATFRRLEDDLLLPEPHPTAVELGAVGALLPMKRSHFDTGAVLFPDLPDTAVVYRRLDGTGPRIRISWTGFDTLTLWSASGGEFLCIEPWTGRPQEAGSTTPDTQREDLQHLAAGESRIHEYRLDIG